MRPLTDIANDILHHWVGVSPHAMPYVLAMLDLRTVDDRYGADDGRTIVLYFLSNAGAFRGPEARRLKAELKEHLGER